MRRRTILGAVALAVAAAAATGVMATRGTTAEGATPVSVVEYDLGDNAFTDPGGSSELRAVVHYPKRMTGALPVVMLLHGQEVPCYSGESADWTWPCRAGVKPYPINRGLDYLADALARDGFVVVSPSMNSLNHRIGEPPDRARLATKHLAMLQELSATGRGPLAGQFTDPATGRGSDVDFAGHLDLTRVGTMGHGVGGESVFHQAADINLGQLPVGVEIKGVAAIATFTDEGYGTTVTRAPVAVISAECFGDTDHVFYREAKAEHGVGGFLITMVKANHNYFNSVKADGPSPVDGDDTACFEETDRPTEAQQQNATVAYLRAFFAYALKGDRRGLPVLTGATPVDGVTTEVESFGSL